MKSGVDALGIWFASRGWPLYLVGGAVRNPLLHLPISDYDLAGPITPDELFVALPSDITIYPTGIKYGTLTLCWHETQVEYTTFRQDFYKKGASSGAHRPEHVQFTTSIEQDALRRDFTINAIYRSLPDNKLVDPVGGLADLQSRLLRIPHPNTFEDDSLRLLRMIRLAAQLGFDIESDTWQNATQRAHTLTLLSRERVGKEIDKMLLCDQSYPHRSHTYLWAFEKLQQAGFLPVLGINHIYLQAELPSSKALRLAALLCGEGLEQITTALCWSKADRQESLLWAHAWDSRNMTDASSRRELLLALPDIEGWLAWLQTADCANEPHWRNDAQWLEEHTPPHAPHQLALDGRTLTAQLGGASPEVGIMQKRLWRWVLAGGTNQRDALLEQVTLWTKNKE